jgi:phage-related holin
MTPSSTRFLFGFCSFQDVWTTIFSKNWSLVTGLSAGLVYAAKLAGLLHKDANVIYILFVLMLFDWLTGTIKAMKMGKFNSFTFQRFFLNLVARFGLIGVGHWMGKLYWVFAVLCIEDILAIGFILTEFVSLVENVAVIEPRLIPSPLMAILKQVTSIDKVLKRFYPQAFAETTAEAASPLTPNETDTADPTLATASGECADKLPA